MSTRDPQELAKQLNDYADQMTRFVLVQALAFLISLSSKDVLETIGKVPWMATIVLWEVINTLELLFVFICHFGEDALIGKPSAGDCTSPWRKYIRFVRIGIILTTDAIMIVAIMIIRLHAG